MVWTLQRFAELKDLYYGKKMHAKALQLLKECVFVFIYIIFFHCWYLAVCSLSEEVSDIEDKLRPSITYLQKLGPEYLDHIFQFSRWIFDQNVDMGFEVRDLSLNSIQTVLRTVLYRRSFSRKTSNYLTKPLRITSKVLTQRFAPSISSTS